MHWRRRKLLYKYIDLTVNVILKHQFPLGVVRGRDHHFSSPIMDIHSAIGEGRSDQNWVAGGAITAFLRT